MCLSIMSNLQTYLWWVTWFVFGFSFEFSLGITLGGSRVTVIKSLRLNAYFESFNWIDNLFQNFYGRDIGIQLFEFRFRVRSSLTYRTCFGHYELWLTIWILSPHCDTENNDAYLRENDKSRNIILPECWVADWAAELANRKDNKKTIKR